jgi:hypothetical protein
MHLCTSTLLFASPVSGYFIYAKGAVLDNKLPVCCTACQKYGSSGINTAFKFGNRVTGAIPTYKIYATADVKWNFHHMNLI